MQQATFWLAQKGFANPDEVGGAATDYLRVFGLVCLGWMWLKMRGVAQQKLSEGAKGMEAYYDAKIKTSRFFAQKMLPEVDARFKSLTAGAEPMMALAAEQF